jgi:hypothetical protein
MKDIYKCLMLGYWLTVMLFTAILAYISTLTVDA